MGRNWSRDSIRAGCIRARVAENLLTFSGGLEDSAGPDHHRGLIPAGVEKAEPPLPWESPVQARAVENAPKGIVGGI